MFLAKLVAQELLVRIYLYPCHINIRFICQLHYTDYHTSNSIYIPPALFSQIILELGVHDFLKLKLTVKRETLVLMNIGDEKYFFPHHLI